MQNVRMEYKFYGKKKRLNIGERFLARTAEKGETRTIQYQES
jgi:hypothetical protein